VSEKVCAVIVTYNRKDLLRECLNAVLSQTRPPDHVLVVDNASTDGTPEMLEAEFPQVEVLRLPENQGSSGGFHEGMKRAYEEGQEWIWVLDDDTIPEATTLFFLLEGAKRYNLDIASPIAVSYDDPEKLAWPLLNRGMLTYDWRSVLQNEPRLGENILFLGVLLNRHVVERVGLPDPRLFIRGEEVEYNRRILRAGLRTAILPWVRVRHPSFSGELFFLLGRRFAVVYSGSQFKNFYNFRNRMYIFRKHSRLWPVWALLEAIRHALFFLLLRRWDWPGFVFWANAAYLGLRGRLIPYKDFAKEN
jgi:rhamnopyranosyl-N-acetylglucosaminyl-diphospho-decaprenol beta-1,3/1,4-galactofuranosyltransferase